MALVASLFCLLLTCNVQLAKSSRNEVLPRHPREHVASVTYETLEVFQSYSVDRRDTDQSLKLFRTCNGLSGHREIIPSDDSHGFILWRPEKPCRAVLQNCRFDESMREFVRFCVSRDQHRRYDYMEIKKNSEYRYGRNLSGICPSSKFETFHADSVWHPCVCDCENSDSQTDRYFSLEEVVADSGKVVTGVRFRKIDHVYYIQIQQGQPGPNKTILGEVEWKAISKTDSKWMPVPKYDGEHLLKFYRSDWIYAVTTDQNTVLLDDLEAGSNEVLTGFKFRHVGNDLRFDIRVTKWNSEGTGISGVWADRWVHNDIHKDMSVTREEVKLPVPIVSNQNATMNVSSTSGHQFVKFQVSDFKTDLGQTTVPFIDMRDVVPERPRPLSGAGIFLEGSPGLAGLIALKLF